MLDAPILDAISSSTDNPASRIKAGVLVETFLNHFERRFGQMTVEGVEVPFWFRIASWPVEEVGPEMYEVWLAGYLDVLLSIGGERFGQELKTTSKWEEADWLDEIGQSPQPIAEALALSRGRLLLNGAVIEPKVKDAMVSVCALTKSNQPEVWPTNLEKSAIDFSPERLTRFATYVEVRGRQILASRASTPNGPWGWTGPHCALYKHKAKPGEHQEYCRFYEQCCAHDAPPCTITEREGGETRSDDLRRIIERAEGLEAGYLDKPNVVVLSPSSLQVGNQCLELYRLTRMAPKVVNTAADIGTATHVGIEAFLKERIKL